MTTTLIYDIFKMSTGRRIFYVYQNGNLEREELNRFSVDRLGLPFLLGDVMETKQCYGCKKIKQVNMFYRYKSGVNRGYYHSYCKECSKQRKYAYDLKNPWRVHCSAAKTRTSKSSKQHKNYKKLEFSITYKDIKEIWFRDKAYLLTKASIHRKNDNLGYIKSNCCFIELRINQSLGTKIRDNTYLLGNKFASGKRTKQTKGATK